MSRVAKRSTTFLGLIVLVALVIPLALRMTSRPVSAAAQQGSIASTDLRVNLIRAGLDVNALAAAGVQPAQISALVTSGKTASNGLVTSLKALDEAYGNARATRDALQRKIQSGLASQEVIGSFAAAELAVTNADAARKAAIAAVFAGATQSLSSEVRARLTTIEANRRWKLPIEFLTVNREETEWVALRDALSNERITAKYEEPINPACQALLSAARANQTVAAAKTAFDANLAATTVNWNSSTSD